MQIKEAILASHLEKSKQVTLILDSIKELLSAKSTDYGPVADILDLLTDVTGYSKADIPGAEAQGCYRVISKIVRYMQVRGSGELATTEKLSETIFDLLGEALRFYVEVIVNTGGTFDLKSSLALVPLDSKSESPSAPYGEVLHITDPSVHEFMLQRDISHGSEYYGVALNNVNLPRDAWSLHVHDNAHNLKLVLNKVDLTLNDFITIVSLPKRKK